MDVSQTLSELHTLYAELVADYHAGRLSPEKAREFEAIRERIKTLEARDEARFSRE
jgi:hypothetical protein